MAETLAGNINRHSGIHFLPSLSCSSPTFLIHRLPFLSDEQHLSEASLTGGEEPLTDRDLSFPFSLLLVWRCLPSKGLGKRTVQRVLGSRSAARGGGIAATISPPTHGLCKCGVSVLFFNLGSSRECHWV